ncbi:MAG: response regulator transcription factor [Akkermansiaceae bacterium]|nr:response regulator transcription factor [Akkermansiaceae bacterium]NNM30626.1 response regulator transcription factor [Akkermansiaceae bacterium]
MSAKARKEIEVAVIEDNVPLAKVLEKLVNEMDGARCIGIWQDAEEGLKKIDAFRPDVVLMDIVLPGMSGIQATARLGKELPDVEVIMVTAYDDEDKVFDALKAGASGYLLKEATPDELRRAIIDVWNGGAPMSADIARRVVQAFHRPPAHASEQAVNLSRRESQILSILADGLSNKEIAHELDISVETVRVHLRNIYEKLHVRSRLEAAMKYRDSLEKRPGG